MPNPFHDPMGRFTHGSGGGSSMSPSEARASIHAKTNRRRENGRSGGEAVAGGSTEQFLADNPPVQSKHRSEMNAEASKHGWSSITDLTSPRYRRHDAYRKGDLLISVDYSDTGSTTRASLQRTTKGPIAFVSSGTGRHNKAKELFKYQGN